MFLKTAELKKLMKDALKRSGLVVGYVNGNYLDVPIRGEHT